MVGGGRGGGVGVAITIVHLSSMMTWLTAATSTTYANDIL